MAAAAILKFCVNGHNSAAMARILWRDVGVCVPFPFKQIKVNNVIDNIIQNIDNICLLYTSDAADE